MQVVSNVAGFNELVPNFKFTSKGENWADLWPAVLLRHGPPPKGVKWYGEKKRVHLTTTEAREYVSTITLDCRTAIETSGFMSHYHEGYRQMLALKMKNDYLEWCREYLEENC